MYSIWIISSFFFTIRNSTAVGILVHVTWWTGMCMFGETRNRIPWLQIVHLLTLGQYWQAVLQNDSTKFYSQQKCSHLAIFFTSHRNMIWAQNTTVIYLRPSPSNVHSAKSTKSPLSAVTPRRMLVLKKDGTLWEISGILR